MLRLLALTPGQQQEMGMAGRAKMEREFDQAHVVAAYRGAIADAVSASNRHPKRGHESARLAA
jgi:hypothetical protein